MNWDKAPWLLRKDKTLTLFQCWKAFSCSFQSLSTLPPENSVLRKGFSWWFPWFPHMKSEYTKGCISKFSKQLRNLYSERGEMEKWVRQKVWNTRFQSSSSFSTMNNSGFLILKFCTESAKQMVMGCPDDLNMKTKCVLKCPATSFWSTSKKQYLTATCKFLLPLPRPKDRISLYNRCSCPGPCSVDRAGLQFTEICLPLPPKCWD